MNTNQIDLRNLMRDHNLTAHQVGEMLDRSPKTIYAWRTNRVPPDWVVPILRNMIDKGLKFIVES